MEWISKPPGSLIAGLLLLAVLLSPGTAYTDPAMDPVLEWNTIMRTTVAEDSPFLQSRSATMMHLAVFEAVNTIVGNYKPYLGTIEAPAGASPEAAAIAAAHRTLVNLYLRMSRASMPRGMPRCRRLRTAQLRATV
jgi:hypothetical protein